MNALHQYQSVNRQTSIVDADGHKLIQLLFDGALERITMAKGQILANNFEGKNRLIGKAVEIVGGLREFLDKEKGGDIAERLDALYEYMERRLFEANLQNDATILDEVAGLLKQVKNGWDGIRQEALEKGLV
ncbi:MULTISPECIES: flagellar export chaperone FliS [unclassified Hahella]|uniref:flagellar export chaperone FliS n=1 Tax=unclassified Hahella TaxID=2624107 RepID=UPI000FDDF5D5|nr:MULTISPECIES: flagellar export chaperone FliS [unclassified Hahella]AZZ91291.1 flagellar export chaperone FliS [Hahella sp. KA22]MBU6953016.1 flagellar export chaperone FliS [Hahella sp. HN01]MDG9668662.1 flagellar export chaperone FliS [Hahella sp. CR1]QAY54660.1 flagellar export chaperone FliS [Hahella sp. KA22]